MQSENETQRKKQVDSMSPRIVADEILTPGNGFTHQIRKWILYSHIIDFFEDIFDWSTIIGLAMINKGKINLLSVVNGDLGMFDKEDKSVFYEKVKKHNSQYILNYRKIPHTWTLSHKFKEILEFTEEHGYPIVLKPIRSKYATLAFKIVSGNEVMENLEKFSEIDFLVQKFCEDPEYLVFYMRYPNQHEGLIPFVSRCIPGIDEHGDPQFRHAMQLGSVYQPCLSVINSELQEIFDKISRDCNFHYGRYDLKAHNLNPEQGAIELKLLEFNDPFSMDRQTFGSLSLAQFYKSRFLGWKFCFDVAKINLSRGFQLVPLMQFIRSNFNEVRLDRVASRLDKK